MMRYMLLINIDKSAPPLQKGEEDAILQGHKRFEAEFAGKIVDTERLRPEAEARCVRLQAGRPLVTDGPFAETKEVLGGFYVVECGTMDEAIECAGKIPLREGRAIEVWPTWPR